MRPIESAVTRRTYFGDIYIAEIKSFNNTKEYHVLVNDPSRDDGWHQFRIYKKFKPAYEFAQTYVRQVKKNGR